MKSFSIFLILTISFFACTKEKTLFNKLSTAHTGIKFSNTIINNDTLDAFNFVNFYNGAGVGIADFNNDGLPDVCMIANQNQPSLYLNKGKLSFNKVEGSQLYNQGWINGISIVDVNQDGWLDIYFSTAKHIAFKNSKNLLFINQKTSSPTFKEEANKYGLDYDGYSTQIVFFDIENDGDLDAYMLNTNPNVMDPNTYRRSINDGSFPTADRLYENLGKDSLGHYYYKDISKEAGILYEGLGLGISLADFNDDGFTDVYCSNDFITDDLLYINQGNKKFKNLTKKSFKHTSLFGMGVDAADINNDAHIDIMQLDMMPDRNERRKMMLMRNDYDRKELTVTSQYDYIMQYMRNTLQINQGIRDSIPLFSDQSLMYNVAATDWSWGVLLADYDCDGWKDMLVTNGYRKNITDLDFINYHQSGESAKNKRLSTSELLKIVPEIKLRNFAFKNTKSHGFEDVSKIWGIDDLSYSNGLAHADLDLDGDLDVVVNNIDEEAFVYENTSKEGHTITINFNGTQGNLDGLGAKVSIFQNKTQQTYVNYPTRGYLSSMQVPMIVGLGDTDRIDSMIVKWPSGKVQKLYSLTSDKITLKETDAHDFLNPTSTSSPFFTSVVPGINYLHVESSFVDFHITATLQKMITRNGPVIVKGRIDADSLEDIVIGGAYAGSQSAVYFQNKNGSFSKAISLSTNTIEVGDIAILDINGDSKNDLIFAPGIADKRIGSNLSFSPITFINQGDRQLIQSTIFPDLNLCSEKILVNDFDNNGVSDILFTGGYILGQYPKTMSSILLIHDGKGNWNIKPENWLPHQAVKDITLSDVDMDGDKDILYTGHWTGVNILMNDKGRYKIKQNNIPNGWWNKMIPMDIDNDGDEDLILGNEGLNSYFKASEKEPVSLYSKDFNSDGALDPLYTQYIYKEPHVIHPLGTLTEQSVYFKKRFNNFSSYAKANFYEVIKLKELKDATQDKVTSLKSCMAINDGKGNYTIRDLPYEVQSSPVMTILAYDVNFDGYQDCVLAGNFYPNDASQGRSDASYGHLLINNKRGNFDYIKNNISGLKMDGDVRSAVILNKSKTIIFGRNQGIVGRTIIR